MSAPLYKAEAEAEAGELFVASPGPRAPLSLWPPKMWSVLDRATGRESQSRSRVGLPRGELRRGGGGEVLRITLLRNGAAAWARQARQPLYVNDPAVVCSKRVKAKPK